MKQIFLILVALFLFAVTHAHADDNLPGKTKEEKLFDSIRQIAEKGEPRAQLMLSGFYKSGTGTPKDGRLAANWARKSAEKGYVPAMTEMGRNYMKGEGVTKSDIMAVSWLKKAAAKGDADAQVYLGEFYQNGKGGLTVDHAAAIRFFQFASEQKHRIAQYHLCVAYINDPAAAPGLAFKLCKASAEKGYLPAIHRTGVILLNGYGVKKDVKEGIPYIRTAAKNGYAESQYVLGMAHETGEGVEKNPGEAKKWYKEAALRGHMPAGVALERMERQELGLH